MAYTEHIKGDSPLSKSRNLARRYRLEANATDSRIQKELLAVGLPTLSDTDISDLPQYTRPIDIYNNRINELEKQSAEEEYDIHRERSIISLTRDKASYFNKTGRKNDETLTLLEALSREKNLHEKIIGDLSNRELNEKQSRDLSDSKRAIERIEHNAELLNKQQIQHNFYDTVDHVDIKEDHETQDQLKDVVALRNTINREMNQHKARGRKKDNVKDIETSQSMVRSDDAKDLIVPEPIIENGVEKKLEYFPHQAVAIDHILERGEYGKGTLIADPPGAGKTIMALGAANNLPDGPAKRILLVVPNSVKRQWLDEAKKWLVNRDEMNYYIISAGRTQPVPVIGDDETGTVIINYEQLRNKSVADSIKSTDWDMVVLDESHSLINHDSFQTKAIIGGSFKRKSGEVVEHSPLPARYKIAMTGTPTDYLPVHLYNTLSYLDPDYWGDPQDKKKRDKFADDYTVYQSVQRRPKELQNEGALRAQWEHLVNTAQRTGSIDKIKGELKGPDKTVKVAGTKNEKQLQERLRSNGMVLRSEKEIYELANVPDPSRRIVEFSASDADPLSDSEKKALAMEIETLDALNQVTTSNEPPQLGHISWVKRLTGQAKAPRVGRYVAAAIKEAQSATGSKRPILVFSWHKGVQDIIHDTLIDEGINPTRIAQIDGDTSEKIRSDTIKKFQSVDAAGDSPYQVMLSTVGVGGTGLNLQRADHVIFSELEWQPKQLSQAEHRAYRIGQDSPVLIEYLVLSNSLDGFIADNLVGKLSSTDAMLGGDKRSVMVEGGEDLISKEHAERISAVLDWERKSNYKKERESPASKEIHDWVPVTDAKEWPVLHLINQHMDGDASRVWVRTTMLFDDEGMHEPVKIILFRDEGVKGNKVRLFSYREDNQELQELNKRFSTIVDAKAELQDTLPYMIEVDDSADLQKWQTFGLSTDIPLWTDWDADVQVRVKDESGEVVLGDDGEPVVETVSALEYMRRRAVEKRRATLSDDEDIDKYFQNLNWQVQEPLTDEKRAELERIRKRGVSQTSLLDEKIMSKEDRENLRDAGRPFTKKPTLFDDVPEVANRSNKPMKPARRQGGGQSRLFRQKTVAPKPNMPSVIMGDGNKKNKNLISQWFKKHKPPKYAR